MANQEHLDILRRGAEVWNQWRKEHLDIQPNLHEADLRRANLRTADLNQANLNQAILRAADLFQANLRRADLSQANLSRVDLRAADLSRANLSRADLSRADLNQVNLSQANLNQAVLRAADLFRADLNQANLSRADLRAANLRAADLSGANLRAANLSQANLSGADLSGATVGWTTFGDVDLSHVQGLETVEHQGPSTIGIDTIYRSHSNILDSFLQQAGVPETFLTYMRSLVVQPLDYFSCFISYSSTDKRFCDHLSADLLAEGIRTWYFPEDAKWGEPIWAEPVWGEIDRSIKVYDKLVVVCSEHSLQSSPVQREIELALKREDREHKHILFPISIDNYLFERWDHPRKDDVVSKVVGDFRGWNRGTKKYHAAFERLLKALKTET